MSATGQKQGTVKAVHRRYYDKPDRPDLRALAVCDNIGAPHASWTLTSADADVTCRRCRRIALGKPIGTVLP